MKVSGMSERRRPIFSWEVSTVEEGTRSNSESVVPLLSAAVLGRTVRTGMFHNLEVFLEEGSAEVAGACELTTLVASYDPPSPATIHLKKVGDEVCRGFFRFA